MNPRDTPDCIDKAANNTIGDFLPLQVAAFQCENSSSVVYHKLIDGLESRYLGKFAMIAYPSSKLSYDAIHFSEVNEFGAEIWSEQVVLGIKNVRDIGILTIRHEMDGSRSYSLIYYVQSKKHNAVFCSISNNLPVNYNNLELNDFAFNAFSAEQYDCSYFKQATHFEGLIKATSVCDGQSIIYKTSLPPKSLTVFSCRE